MGGVAGRTGDLVACRRQTGQDSARPTLWTILFWLGLSAAGSTVLLATTNILTQDIAVSPFLWIAPLSLYLLTFVLAFESDRWYLRRPFAIAMGVLAPASYAVLNAGVGISLSIQLGVYLAALFVACMICHGELRLSPARAVAPHRLLPDDCRRRSSGRRVRRPRRPAHLHRIQRISHRARGSLPAGTRWLDAGRRMEHVDETQHRGSHPAHGAADRRAGRRDRHQSERRSADCRQVAELLRHSARHRSSRSPMATCAN